MTTVNISEQLAHDQAIMLATLNEVPIQWAEKDTHEERTLFCHPSYSMTKAHVYTAEIRIDTRYSEISNRQQMLTELNQLFNGDFIEESSHVYTYKYDMTVNELEDFIKDFSYDTTNSLIAQADDLVLNYT